MFVDFTFCLSLFLILEIKEAGSANYFCVRQGFRLCMTKYLCVLITVFPVSHFFLTKWMFISQCLFASLFCVGNIGVWKEEVQTKCDTIHFVLLISAIMFKLLYLLLQFYYNLTFNLVKSKFLFRIM